jgi:hypothetical protein
VLILVAPYDAMNHAHHVWRAAPGPVSIKALAACHVLHLVFASLVIGAAIRAFPVDTNAQASVVNYVMKTTVTYVEVEARTG